MNCNNLSCSNKAIEITACTKCFLRAYCSESCRKDDWVSFHKTECQAHCFTFSDFIPVPEKKFLGKGSYGHVQLVRHKSTGELYALKDIKKVTKTRQAPIKMLYREISVQKKLIHENIIRLYDSLETPDQVTLVLEYADAGNLYYYLKKKIRLTERKGCFFFTQLCNAVKYLHDLNIIHRDLKPDNILLTKADCVKVCDFGWCVEGIEERTTYCGTLDYMAPEILKGGQYTNKIDIWSLGIILYELLQGQTPFNGRNQVEKLKSISCQKLEFKTSVSQAAKALLKKLLAYHAEDRPSIDEVLENEWILRYKSFHTTEDSLKSSCSTGRLGFEAQNDDDFDFKLSKNYPPSYTRLTGVSNIHANKFSAVTSANILSLREDTNSNKSSYAEENEEKIMCSVISQSELNKKKQDLENLQAQLEGKKKKKPKQRSFFSKVFDALGLI
ncbi:hypothetical protein SteCoe_38325 [Stentor coeruleus]|uniref:Uncharacterized protein n=1 Tax=Stentor coeruleus TaxID=5963 RepID=A0A1R2ALJ2_9CILI|nr:hypothetical protein SteCoe_38325 [Stentor coeruleus]